MESDSLTLECICQGRSLAAAAAASPISSRLLVDTEDLEFSWLRNNKEIPENPDFRREREGDVFKLVVAEV